MKPEPTIIQFDLGRNPFGQPVTLTKGRGTGGELIWTIHRGMADQRDDEQSVSLSEEQVVEAARCVESLK